MTQIDYLWRSLSEARIAQQNYGHPMKAPRLSIVICRKIHLYFQMTSAAGALLIAQRLAEHIRQV